jgi:hypothetical protein
MINCLIAFNSNQVDNFLDNFRTHITGQDAAGDDIYERIRTDFAPFTDSAGNNLDPYDMRDLMVIMSSQGGWKPHIQGGPVTTILVTMYVRDVVSPDDQDPPEDKLSMVEYLRNFFDGRYQVLGTWYSVGQTHTTTPVYDEVDEELVVISKATLVMHGETITRAIQNDPITYPTIPDTVGGKRTYPLHPQYLKWMPDDVTYNPDPPYEETSRTDATKFKQVNKLQGHSDRGV